MFKFNKSQSVIEKISPIQYNEKDLYGLCSKDYFIVDRKHALFFKNLSIFEKNTNQISNKIKRCVNFCCKVKIVKLVVLNVLFTMRLLIHQKL